MRLRLLRGNTFKYEQIPPFEPHVHASSMSLQRIQIRSIIVYVIKKMSYLQYIPPYEYAIIFGAK